MEVEKIWEVRGVSFDTEFWKELAKNCIYYSETYGCIRQIEECPCESQEGREAGDDSNSLCRDGG